MQLCSHIVPYSRPQCLPRRGLERLNRPLLSNRCRQIPNLLYLYLMLIPISYNKYTTNTRAINLPPIILLQDLLPVVSHCVLYILVFTPQPQIAHCPLVAHKAVKCNV